MSEATQTACGQFRRLSAFEDGGDDVRRKPGKTQQAGDVGIADSLFRCNFPQRQLRIIVKPLAHRECTGHKSDQGRVSTVGFGAIGEHHALADPGSTEPGLDCQHGQIILYCLIGGAGAVLGFEEGEHTTTIKGDLHVIV